jgi:hypothetical protein
MRCAAAQRARRGSAALGMAPRTNCEGRCSAPSTCTLHPAKLFQWIETASTAPHCSLPRTSLTEVQTLLGKL